MSDEFDRVQELVYSQDASGLEQALADVDAQQFAAWGGPLLRTAAMVEGSADIIGLLVAAGADIDAVDEMGCTPLMEAVIYDCPANLRTLLNLGADPNIRNEDGVSPLQNGCAEGNLACVRILLENGVPVDGGPGTKKTPLGYAVYGGAGREMVEYLLESGADIDGGDGYGTALTSAISRQNLPMIELLVERGATIHGPMIASGEDALAFAERVGNEAIVAFLKSRE
jgi:ankyrin repeat protein